MEAYEIKIATEIRALNEKINNIILEELRERGLTQTQTIAIRVIAQYNRLSLTKLSHEMSIRKATASGIIDRLEKIDLIKKERDTKDKREIYIEFSEKGKELVGEITEDLNRCYKRMFSEAKETELIEIYEALVKAKELLQR